MKYTIAIQIEGGGGTSYNFRTRMYPVLTKNGPKAGARFLQIINRNPGQMFFFLKNATQNRGNFDYL